MTLIVAHVSTSAAVMCSDSQAVEEDSTVGTAEKIWTTAGLLFGYSGQMALRDRVRAAIDGQLAAAPPPPNADWEIVASQLCAIVRPILAEAYSNYVAGSGEPAASQALGGSLVVIGKGAEGYWLLEIDRNNSPSNYTEEGFHTTGSASFSAHVTRRLLKHYGMFGDEVRQLRLHAYRTVLSCIEVLGGRYGIGGPVQLWQSTAAGFERLDRDALEMVHEGLDQWIKVEQESLRQVFPPVVAAPAEPLPEHLTEE